MIEDHLFNILQTEIVPGNGFGMDGWDPARATRCDQLFFSVIDALGETEVTALDSQRARRILSLLEVVMSTAHRLADQAPHPVELCYQSAKGGAFLKDLAKAGDHPPRGSHATQWVDTWAPDLITYTPMPQERIFATLTRSTSEVLTRLCDLGFALSDRHAQLGDPEVTEQLLTSAAEIDQLRLGFAQFSGSKTGSETGHDQPKWFLHFRQYLAPLDIAGVCVLGPNPAFVASWPAADILFGLADRHYLADVRARYGGYLSEDIALLERAIAARPAPTVLQQQAADCDGPAVRAYQRIVRALQALSGRHWAAIEEHLVTPSQTEDSNAPLHQSLATKAGVSGRDLDKTWQLLASRRGDNPARKAYAAWRKETVHD
ncbi:MAG: hypothetical protein AB8B51_04215 [Sedimentitalea sp.]